MSVVSFAHGALALTWDPADSRVSGSAFDYELGTAVSKSIGECIERRVVREHFSGELTLLRRKLLDGALGSAFAFDHMSAQRRATREADCRAIRQELWHGDLQASAHPLISIVEEANSELGVTDAQLLRVDSHPQWLGIISWSTRLQGALYSDSLHEDHNKRLESTPLEHLMLHSGAHLPQVRVPRVNVSSEGLANWLTSGRKARVSPRRIDYSTATYPVGNRGFMSVVDCDRVSRCSHQDGDCSPFGPFPW